MWSLFRVFENDRSHTDQGKPRPVTRRLMKMLEDMSQEEVYTDAEAFSIFLDAVEKARQEMSQMNEEKKKARSSSLGSG